ncbi:hypothetical protein Angca_002172, partial [Angiostrongylus cantonensis]
DGDEFEEGFKYEIQTDGVRQGAEARIFVCTYLGRPAIMKERFVKNYRHPVLDKQLNKSRIRNEVKGLVKAHEEDTLELGKAIGEAIGRMHLGNLIHGDLTTSNIILKYEDFRRPFFIDFEDKGVDLYVLERALCSTHMDSEQMFQKILQGYQEVNSKQGKAVIIKLDEIRLRGRKRDMTG